MPGEQRGFVCLYVPERITGRCLRLASLASLSLQVFPSLWPHDLSHLSFDAFLLFPDCRWLRYSTRGETSSCSGFSDRKRSDDLSIHRKIGRSLHSPEDRTVHSPKLTNIGSLRSPQLLKLQIESKYKYEDA